MAFWHWAHSDKCLIQCLIPRLTPVSLLEKNSKFWIVTQRGAHEKKWTSSLVCSLYGANEVQINSWASDELMICVSWRWASTINHPQWYQTETWPRFGGQCAAWRARLPSKKRGNASTASLTWCTRNERSCTGTSARAWRKVRDEPTIFNSFSAV